MKYYIDSADVKKIAHLLDYFPIEGVTTNPAILAKEPSPFLERLQEIRSLIGEERELFVQLLGDTTEEIIAEAQYINEVIRGKVIVKIPVTKEGIKAIKLAQEKGIITLATTIYTPIQAQIAAAAGASYVAPYVNRIDNLTGNGIQVVKDIVQMFQCHQYHCKVLGASFKNVQQIHDVCLTGAYSVTVAPDLFDQFLTFPSTAHDVSEFKRGWKERFGEECANLMKTK